MTVTHYWTDRLTQFEKHNITELFCSAELCCHHTKQPHSRYLNNSPIYNIWEHTHNAVIPSLNQSWNFPKSLIQQQVSLTKKWHYINSTFDKRNKWAEKKKNFSNQISSSGHISLQHLRKFSFLQCSNVVDSSGIASGQQLRMMSWSDLQL